MANFLPYGKPQYFDNSGEVLAGGKIYFYNPASTHDAANQKTAYTDSTGGTNLSNPLVLDSAGRGEAWLDGSYDVVCNTAADATLWSIANVSGVAPASDIQSGSQNWGADSGSTDAYVVALTPAVTSYTNGLVVRVKANTQNAGAATLNAGAGAKDLRINGSNALPTGIFASGSTFEAIWNKVADAWDVVSAPVLFQGARIKRTAELAIPHNTLTTVTWETADFDTANFFNSSANASNLVTPATGVSKAMVAFNVSFTNEINAANIVLTGSNVTGTYKPGSAVNYGVSGPVSLFVTYGPAAVASGDTFFVQVRQTMGSAQNINTLSSGAIWALDD